MGDYWNMSALVWYTDSGATSVESSTNVYDKRYAKLTFNKADVRAIYIDWDDGTDNSKENANYQWVQFDYPVSSAVVEHTYTASGNFKPVIQTVNSQGIFSKYFQNTGTNTSIAPLEESTRITSLGVTDKKPMGVLRLENKQVLSGIDNSLFTEYGSRDIYFAIAPTISGSVAGGLLDAASLDIDAEVEYLNDGHDEGQYTGGSNALITINFTAGNTLDAGYGVEKINSAAYKVKRIVQVRWNNSKTASGFTYTQQKNFNKLKLFILTSGNNTVAAGGGTLTPYYPVTYVSSGTPLKKASDSRRIVNMDMSQSRTSASNTSISGYYYDNGKNWFTPVDEWAGTTTLTSVSGGTDATTEVSYTYQPRPDGLLQKGTTTDAAANEVIAFASGAAFTWACDASTEPRQDQFLLDDFNRFQPQGHLLRTHVSASSTSGSTLDNYAGVFRISPALDWANSGAQVAPAHAESNSICKLYEDPGAAYVTYSKDITTNATTNTQAGVMDTDGINTLAYKNRTDGARIAYEYLLLLASKKHNKIFIQNTPMATDFMSNISGGTKNLEIAGLYYLRSDNHDTVRANMYWKPLLFEDGTKSTKEYRDTGNDTYVTAEASFSKPGFIEFDIPQDWSAVTFDDVMGLESGNAGWDNPEDGGATPIVPTVNPYEWNFSGGCTSVTLGGASGKVVSLTGAIDSTLSGTVANIGAYKYLAILNSGSAGDVTDEYGTAYWVASGSGAGYDGSSTIYLQVGEACYDDGAAPTNYGEFTFFTDAACSTVDETVEVTHIANPLIVAGLTVTGPNIPAGATVASITDVTHFDLSVAATGTGTDPADFGGVYELRMRRVNFYDVVDGANKVWSSTGTGAAAGAWEMNNVDSADGEPWPNRYGFMTGSAAGEALNDVWYDTDLYPLKVVIKGTGFASGTTAAATGAAVGNPGAEMWNILPYNSSASQYVEEIDDHAWDLNSLPITSDIGVSRQGNYYKAITRKGKVFIAKTGVGISKISFNSVALGDEGDTVSDKFDSHGPSSLYGHLRKVRELQANGVRVYWDFPQKDGTFVRFWGIITDVSDTRGASGPRSVVNYTFNMTVEEVAIYDGNLNMITDIFPLGGIGDVRTYA